MPINWGLWRVQIARPAGQRRQKPLLHATFARRHIRKSETIASPNAKPVIFGTEQAVHPARSVHFHKPAQPLVPLATPNGRHRRKDQRLVILVPKAIILKTTHASAMIQNRQAILVQKKFARRAKHQNPECVHRVKSDITASMACNAKNVRQVQQPHQPVHHHSHNVIYV